jgi:hypothetical protein
MVLRFARGHILIEGVPGLAKTSAVKALADTVQADFKRIQFTPDLLPADLEGTEIYRPKTGDFGIKKGPLFNNIILADEINRAPSNVQSALLEAMQALGEIADLRRLDAKTFYCSLSAILRQYVFGRYAMAAPEMTTERINIVLALDLSESMAALDFKRKGRTINRLAAVKGVVHDFVAGRHGPDPGQAERLLNQLQDQPGRVLMPVTGDRKGEKDWYSRPGILSL